MWRVTLRGVLAHKLRLALSGLAVVLGVAFVSGTMIFTDTLGRTFSDLFASTAADVTVEPASALGAGIAGSGGTASFVPSTLVEVVAEADGVRAAEGYVQTEGVYVLDRSGEVVDTGGAPGLGVSWYEREELSPSRLVEGRAPQGPGEVALDSGTAAEAGYEVGDHVPLLTPGPRVEAEVVGVFTFGESGGLAGASLAAFDLETAQRLLARPDALSGISVVAADGHTDEEVRDSIAARVGKEYDVQTGEEQADAQAADLEKGLAFVSTFLLVFAGVALFVGTFLILNTFSMLVAQRTRELALLRALGAGRGQVTRSVLAEAVVLGVVGSTVGLAAGVGIAAGLRALFGRFGLTLDGDLVFAADTVAWSYAVGVAVTLLAAYVPARRAARTPPVAALRDDHVAVEKSLRRRTGAGLVLAAAGAGALAAGASAEDGSRAASYVGLGSVALVLAAVALSPALVRPLVRAAGVVLPRLWGRTGHLALENVLRNPRRTAATASALMVGLALVSAFTVIGASTSASVDELVDDAVVAEYIVSTRVGQPFTPEVAQRLRDVAGVSAVMQERFGTAHFAGEESFFAAVDPATLDRTLVLDHLDGGTEGLAGDGVLVDQPTAERRGWEVGDVVPTSLPNGDTIDLTVGGVFEPNQAAGPMVVSLETSTAHGGAPLDRYVYVDVADDADLAAVRSSLRAAVAPYPVVQLKDHAEFKQEQRGQVDQLLLLINALLALSVVIAVLGIVNTLALSVIERTREIGLLRAVGMSRGQLRRMVRLESVVVSVYGAVLGLALGTVFGVSLVRALSRQGIEVLVVPGGRLLAFLALAAVVGVLAAVWPARRAAKLQVLRAIATT